MARSLRLSDNQFHIAGPATERHQKYRYLTLSEHYI